uniref:Secreted protein n=1 Tax=Picocystis salinarum TaxID=88271 RepID=A0A7S3XDQ3_9CHLO
MFSRFLAAFSFLGFLRLAIITTHAGRRDVVARRSCTGAARVDCFSCTDTFIVVVADGSSFAAPPRARSQGYGSEVERCAQCFACTRVAFASARCAMDQGVARGRSTPTTPG